MQRLSGNTVVFPTGNFTFSFFAFSFLFCFFECSCIFNQKRPRYLKNVGTCTDTNNNNIQPDLFLFYIAILYCPIFVKIPQSFCFHRMPLNMSPKSLLFYVCMYLETLIWLLILHMEYCFGVASQPMSVTVTFLQDSSTILTRSLAFVLHTDMETLNQLVYVCEPKPF